MSLTERLNLAEDSRRGGFEPPGNAPEMPLPLMQGGDSDERMQHMLHKSLLITASQDSGWMDLAARRMQRRIHWFAPFAAVLLLISLSNCASTNQFFPHVSGRSFVDPWASCIRPDNETARPTYGLQHQPVFDAELCSQFLLDEYSVAHFSHGFLLLFWLVALPVRTLRGNHTCPACLGGIVLSLRSSPAEWPCFASPDDTSFDWMGFYLAMLLEIALKLHQNSVESIQSYQEAHPEVGPHYKGDSSLNCLGDVLCCAAGFLAVEELRRSEGYRYKCCDGGVIQGNALCALMGTIYFMGILCYSLSLEIPCCLGILEFL